MCVCMYVCEAAMLLPTLTVVEYCHLYVCVCVYVLGGCHAVVGFEWNTATYIYVFVCV